MPYYPALDALRFFAAFAVVIAHIETYLGKYRLPSHVDWLFRFPLADHAVKFFFVLSAFLITRILVSGGAGGIGAFYMRRIYRIWPVYFLTLFSGAALLYFFPGLSWIGAPIPAREEIPVAAALYVFFMANYVNFFFGSAPFLAHLWTIGLEEQFYLAWPPLLRAGKRSWMWLLPVSVLALVLTRRYVSGIGELGSMMLNQPVETLMIGSFAGLVSVPASHRRSRTLRVLSFAGVALLVACPISIYPWPARLNTTIVAFAFAVLILAHATTERTWLDRPVLRYLGRISYGIYMYHVAVLILGIRGLQQIPALANDPALFHLAVAVVCTVGTLALASLSWHFMEKPLIDRGRRKFGARNEVKPLAQNRLQVA